MLSRPVPRHRCRGALVFLLAAAVVGGAGAGTAAAQTPATVLICEATGNPSAPYVEIRVSQSDLSNYSSGEGDIIPAPAAGCPSAAGSVAPVETTGTTTVTTTAAVTTTTATTVTTTSAAHHKQHKAAAQSGTKGTSSGSLAPSNPVVTTSDTETALTTELAPAETLSTLPRTGGQVPLILTLGLAALLGGLSLRWALVRQQARAARNRR